jgi:DNA-binding transcriptional ArsR family regulator
MSLLLPTPTRDEQGDADLAAIGSLVADRARCRILLALADGRALPASVLASEAGVAASTASSHLGRLVDAGFVTVAARGRYRYYRLAGPEVAALIEDVGRLAPSEPVRSLRQGTRAHALRRARTCYDHLAGRLGVAVTEGLVRCGAMAARPDAGDGLRVGHGSAAGASDQAGYTFGEKREGAVRADRCHPRPVRGFAAASIGPSNATTWPGPMAGPCGNASSSSAGFTGLPAAEPSS